MHPHYQGCLMSACKQWVCYISAILFHFWGNLLIFETIFCNNIGLDMSSMICYNNVKIPEHDLFVSAEDFNNWVKSIKYLILFS